MISTKSKTLEKSQNFIDCWEAILYFCDQQQYLLYKAINQKILVTITVPEFKM
jgi:hypothetical protein